MGIREELWFRTEDFAGGDCLLLSDLGLGSPEEAAITSEGRAAGAYDLVSLPGQNGDEPASAGFGIVGMSAEDNNTQLLGGVILGMEWDNQTDRRDQGDRKLHLCYLMETARRLEGLPNADPLIP
jgi:hypothetical protein